MSHPLYPRAPRRQRPIVALIVIGLIVDQHVAVWGQHIVNIVTWATLLYWLTLSAPETQMSMVICVLYATAGEIFLSLGLEIYGTALGNWVWRHEVPVLGWTTMNPPLAAGTFYCMLDMLVVTTMAALRRRNRTLLEPC